MGVGALGVVAVEMQITLGGVGELWGCKRPLRWGCGLGVHGVQGVCVQQPNTAS